MWKDKCERHLRVEGDLMVWKDRITKGNYHQLNLVLSTFYAGKNYSCLDEIIQSNLFDITLFQYTEEAWRYMNVGTFKNLLFIFYVRSGLKLQILGFIFGAFYLSSTYMLPEYLKDSLNKMASTQSKQRKYFITLWIFNAPHM